MRLSNLTNGAFWGITSQSPSISLLIPAFILSYPPFIPVIIIPSQQIIYLLIVANTPNVDEETFMLYQIPTVELTKYWPDVQIGVKYGS